MTYQKTKPKLMSITCKNLVLQHTRYSHNFLLNPCDSDIHYFVHQNLYVYSLNF